MTFVRRLGTCERPTATLALCVHVAAMILPPPVRFDFRRPLVPGKFSNAPVFSKSPLPSIPNQSDIEEVDEEENTGQEVSGDAGSGFVWDPTRACLIERVDKPTSARVETTRTSKASVNTCLHPSEATHGGHGRHERGAGREATATLLQKEESEEGNRLSGESCNEGNECESSCLEESEEDEEADSRRRFLESASTPELIRQAVAVGGEMARSVTDRWVLDQATGLYFRQESNALQMICWNGDQGCMYRWVERGRLDFLWASSASAGGPPPANASAVRPLIGPAKAQLQEVAHEPGAHVAAQDAQVDNSPHLSLWVTVIPPKILNACSIQPGEGKASVEVELTMRALAAVVGKAGATVKELERSSGAIFTATQPAGGEKVGCLRIDGSKAQVDAAKIALEQRLVVALGADAVEKIQKKASSELLDQKRKETGADAAKAGVAGLSEFCQTWGVQAVWARKLSRLDAQLQRHLLRHFEPKKAKPMTAVRSYLAALLKHPQRWRLEALYEDGELDGEVCETAPIGTGGAVVGAERGMEEEAQDDAEAGAACQQLIELECGGAASSREASRYFGDVRPQHCRLFRAGSDHFALALESEIGTIVDGQKCRQQDGPVPLRDGSTVVVGRYVLYCEVGAPSRLQERRARLLAGERSWVKDAEDNALSDVERRKRPEQERFGIVDSAADAPMKRCRVEQEEEGGVARDMEYEAMKALGLPVGL